MKHVLSALLLASLAAGTANAGELRGTPEAVAKVDLMLERLGGHENWAEARTLHLVYSGWQTGPAKYLREEAWRDLTQPYEHITYAESDEMAPYLTFNLTPETSWLWVRGENRMFPADEHAVNVDFWSFDFYTVLRNLAAGDERLTVSLSEDERVVITGPDGADWGWFEIDETGQPVRWGASYGDEALSYLYGPVTVFGAVSFPAWGTAADGSWRFDYETVELLDEPVPVDLSPPPED